MTNVNDFNEVREHYDQMQSNKLRRRDKLKAEIQSRMAEEEQAEIEELARLLHHKFNLGMTKSDLRQATRQYRSPRFKEIWDAVEYESPEGGREKAPYVADAFILEGDQVTFTRDRGDWDWTGLEAESLTFTVHESENSGSNALRWGRDESENAMFNMKNMVAVREALKGVEL